MKNRYLLSPVLAAAALSLLVAGCSSTTGATGGASSSSSSDMMQASSSSTAAVAPQKKYRDGLFASTGHYGSPGGDESIDVSLTLKNGVITNATFKGNAQGEISQRMQSNFSQGFKEQVVGQSIDALNLGVVNGSSLTPMGFMDAVEKIKVMAQA